MINPFINRSTDRPTNQQIKRPINQPINEPINQSELATQQKARLFEETFAADTAAVKKKRTRITPVASGIETHNSSVTGGGGGHVAPADVEVESHANGIACHQHVVARPFSIKQTRLLIETPNVGGGAGAGGGGGISYTEDGLPALPVTH